MRTRANYGVVGSVATANLSGGGIYTSFDQQILKKTQNWLGVPGNPTIGTATGIGGGSATVSFTAPTSTGGGISFYTVTSNPGNITATGSSSPITVTGLTSGVSYTFTVQAVNTFGTSYLADQVIQ